jgi:hypothetical protein
LGKFFESYDVAVPKHGTRIYVAEADTRLERTRYEAETAYGSAYSEIEWNVCQYSEASFCSGGYKAGYVGGSEKNDLQWRDVYSFEGGTYQLTIAYICGENRNITISVNGEKVQTVSCNSGGWDKVATRNITIQLAKGRNVIRLSNPSNWMPDIDYILLKNKSASAAINATESDNRDDDRAYSLLGREVDADNTQHAVVIKNGKKILK